MQVMLSPDQEALVARKIGEGTYRDAEEIIAEVLRLLEERDAHERLKAELQIGLD